MEAIEWFRKNPDASVDDAAQVFTGTGSDRFSLERAKRAASRGPVSPAPEDLAALIGADLTPTAKAVVRAGGLRPLRIAVPEQKKVKATLQRGECQTLVVSDLHAGKNSHDPHALDLVIQIGQAAKVDEVIWNGDMFDCHSLSKYTPSSERPIRWAEERQEALVPIATLYHAFEGTRQIFHYGNHCARPEKFIASACPQLQGLWTLESLLGLDGFDFEYPENNRSVVGGKVLVKHGVRVSGEAAASVVREIRDHGMSVVMGHVHRLGYTSMTKTVQSLTGDPHWFGVEQGCLANLRPDYMESEQTANWQHGAVMLTQYKGGLVVPEFIQIFGRQAVFRGMVFTSRVL